MGRNKGEPPIGVVVVANVGMVTKNRRVPKRKMNYSIIGFQLREKIMGRNKGEPPIGVVVVANR